MSVFDIIGPLFGIFFMIIWITVIVSIVQAMRRQSHVTKDVFNTVNQRIKDLSSGNASSGSYRTVYTGPSKGKEAPTSDDFSEVDDRFDDPKSFKDDLNPRSSTIKQSNRVRKTTKVNGFSGRKARKYAVDSSEMPAHGRLSKESRDDEKEWF